MKKGMKKTGLVRILLLIAYCVPYVFLSVNGDAISGTMLFYGAMVIGFSLLCWTAIKTKNIAVLFVGNVISFVSSYVFAKLTGLEPMGQYFKPFTSYALIVAISIVAIIIQTVIVLIYVTKKKRSDSNPIG